MTVREMIALGRGIMIATHQGGTRTVIATIAGEVAVIVVVAVGAEVGVKTVFETANERERERETGIEIEIVAGAGLSAELDPEAGVEVSLRQNFNTILIRFVDVCVCWSNFDLCLLDF